MNLKKKIVIEHYLVSQLYSKKRMHTRKKKFLNQHLKKYYYASSVLICETQSRIKNIWSKKKSYQSKTEMTQCFSCLILRHKKELVITDVKKSITVIAIIIPNAGVLKHIRSEPNSASDCDKIIPPLG